MDKAAECIAGRRRYWINQRIIQNIINDRARMSFDKSPNRKKEDKSINGGITMTDITLEDYLKKPSRKVTTKGGKPVKVITTEGEND